MASLLLRVSAGPSRGARLGVQFYMMAGAARGRVTGGAALGPRSGPYGRPRRAGAAVQVVVVVVVVVVIVVGIFDYDNDNDRVPGISVTT